MDKKERALVTGFATRYGFPNVVDVATLIATAENLLNEKRYIDKRHNDIMTSLENMESRLMDTLVYTLKERDSVTDNAPQTGKVERELPAAEKVYTDCLLSWLNDIDTDIKSSLKSLPKPPKNVVHDEIPSTPVDGLISRDCKPVVVKGWGLYEGHTFDGIIPPDNWEHWGDANNHLKSNYVWSSITPDGSLRGWRSKRDRITGDVVTGAKKNRKARKA